MKLGKAGFSCRLADASLTTRFGVYSFICIGVMTAVLWYIVSHNLTKDMLHREWETTAKFVRTEVEWHMTSEDFRAQDLSAVAHKFELLHRQIVIMPHIVRIKVYNRQGVIIWSDEKRLVGTSFADNAELQKAFGGTVVVDLSPIGKGENVYERGPFEGLVELYVPILSEEDKSVVGVVETYVSADSLFRDIRRARILILSVAAAGGVLLYLSLFAIVRQAAKKIAEQQENLLKMQSELVASQRMAAVGEMAAAVAHGIGNPLSSIRAAAQVAKLQCEDNKECQYHSTNGKALGNIIGQVDRVQQRMQGLLNIAKPMEPRLAPVELNPLLRDIVGVLQTRFTEAGVTPKLELSTNLPKVRVDANHVEQIFMGLITNALEATPKGGSVTIRTRIEPGNGASPRVVVSVEDTGEGIPLENRQRVFEPFFTTKAHGTGIGLPLAKKFVERNGGTIRISDASTGGAKIDVAFAWNGLN